MFDWITLFFNLCLLKKAPQDLPYSLNLLKILVATNIFVNFLLANMSANWFNALLKAVVGGLLIIGFSWISLFFSRKPARFCQTTCALLGADALIGIFSFPAVATMSLNQSELLAFLVMMSLIIWYWIVTGHIMRNALSQNFGFGLGLAFLYLLISFQVTALIS